VIEIGSADDWQDHPDCPHRVVFGQDRVVQCRDGDEVTVSTSCIQFGHGSIDSAAVAEIADNRAVIDQAKGMLILLYGVDDESAFGMVRRRSQSTNVKLRALAGQLVSDYRALSNGEALPPRWVYEKTLMIIHERIARDRSDSPVASLVHREPDRPPESPHWQARKRFGSSSPGNRQAG
jgi:hypothetical protein